MSNNPKKTFVDMSKFWKTINEYNKQKGVVSKMQIRSNFKMSAKEQEYYLNALKEKEGTLDNISEVYFSLNKNNNDVDVDYTIKEPKFERIRRITGYLTGDLNRWNNAKQAEEHDRVKHI